MREKVGFQEECGKRRVAGYYRFLKKWALVREVPVVVLIFIYLYLSECLPLQVYIIID